MLVTVIVNLNNNAVVSMIVLPPRGPITGISNGKQTARPQGDGRLDDWELINLVCFVVIM